MFPLYLLFENLYYSNVVVIFFFQLWAQVFIKFSPLSIASMASYMPDITLLISASRSKILPIIWLESCNHQQKLNTLKLERQGI